MRAVKTLLKSIAWIAVALVLLVLGLLTAGVKILTPERLTPLVEKIANGYLNAKVDVGRIELTFWSSFPKLTLEVDSLTIVSHSLNSLPDSIARTLPNGSDSLASVARFNGSINIMRLAIGEIALSDVDIVEPMINIVCVNDSVSNFNIAPPSEPDTTTTEGLIPNFSINRFSITGAKPFRFTSLSDSISGSVTLRRMEFSGTEAPTYKIELGGDLNSPLLNEFNFDKLIASIDGKIAWDKDHPYAADIDGLNIGIDSINASINTSLDFTDSLVVNRLDLKIHPVPLSALLSHIPAAYANWVKPLSTPMTIAFDCRLTSPWSPGDTALPSLTANLDIPQCPATYGKAQFNKLALNLSADINGHNLDKSQLKVNKLIVAGPATTINITGTATSLISDPAIDSKVVVDVVMNRFPPQLRRLIPAEVNGRLRANARIKARQSYLTQNKFHLIKIDGNVDLSNFSASIPADSISLWLNSAKMKFDSSKSFARDNHRIDSLLAVGITLDTLSAHTEGINLNLSNLKARLSTANRASSTDTSQINPIAGRIMIGRLIYNSTADTIRARLRDVDCRASLRRFKGDGKSPQLSLKFNANRMSAATPAARMALRESEFKVTAHLNPKRQQGARTKAMIDSLATLYPELSADSLTSLARAEMRARMRSMRRADSIKMANSEVLDFGLDNDSKNLLRRWAVKGSIKAKSGRMFTPYFPLRNRLSNIDLDFTTDSVVIRDLLYNVGRSDFTINGTISNIRRALTSRRNSPLQIEFSLNSDTIDVNELARAAFAGSAAAESGKLADSKSLMLSDSDDSTFDKAISQTDTTATGAFLVPRNIDANLKMRAKNIIYADMLLRRFRGIVNVYDGAINLDRLSARTDIGSINMTALYNAPDKQNMEFGFGMQIKDFHIAKFIELFPAIDSIMPMLSDIRGIINADIAATSNVDTLMNLDIPSMRAAVKLEGDSLVLMDAETFRILSKWLMFKNKEHNMIDHMSVEMLIENSQLELFPFMFDIDRYRLGVMGTNDLALNLNYHISVLKSPLPFKFGINILGNADDMKIRVGGAKFKENMTANRVQLVDNTRINLMNQIQNVFRRGVKAARLGQLDVRGRPADRADETTKFTAADSLLLIKEGLIEAPPTDTVPTPAPRKRKRR